MNLEKIHKVVSHIKAELFKNSNSYSIGKLKSKVRGSGLQFKDYQVYCPGDDVRFIDWKLLARTGNTYIKLYEEERHVEVVILIDFSFTMLYGSNRVTKLQAILEITFLLLLLFESTGDRARFIMLCQKPINIYPLKGEAGIAKVILELEKKNILKDGKINADFNEEKSLRIEDKLAFLHKYIKKNKEIIFFSEFESSYFQKLTTFFKNKRSHLFKITSEIDETKKFPFLIFGARKSSSENKVGFYKAGDTQEEMNLKRQKISKIRVEEKYLEQFVKKFL